MDKREILWPHSIVVSNRNFDAVECKRKIHRNFCVYAERNETKKKKKNDFCPIVRNRYNWSRPRKTSAQSNKKQEICIGCNQFAIRCNCTVQCYVYIAPANKKKKKTANLPFTSNHLAMPTKSNNNKNNVCVHHFFPIHFNVIFVTFSRSKTKWMIMGCQTNDRVGR